MRQWGALGALAVIAVACVMGVDAQVDIPPRSPLSPISPAFTHSLYLPAVPVTVIRRHGVGATYANCGRLTDARVEWFYNWGVNPPDCPGIERVAMIWDERYIDKPIDPAIEWVMGFNEPELTTQANITPTYGAELWREVEQRYPNRRLVSPSAGVWWLDDWWNAYVGMYGEPPRVDAVGHHCYGAFDLGFALYKCQGMADQAVAWANEHGVPEVWVTEFAHLPCWEANGEQASIAFMEAMVNYYRETPEITRWAWFQNSYHGDEPWAFGEMCNTSLVDIDTGELTLMGEAYRALAGE